MKNFKQSMRPTPYLEASKNDQFLLRKNVKLLKDNFNKK